MRLNFLKIIAESAGTTGQAILRDNWKRENVENECDLPGAFMMFLGRQLKDISSVQEEVPEKFQTLIVEYFANKAPHISAMTSFGEVETPFGKIARDVVTSDRKGKFGLCVQITFTHPEGDYCTINSDTMKFETIS